jgi:pimeloyl-[acyl-carrier protein] methyl ester esterase
MIRVVCIGGWATTNNVWNQLKNILGTTYCVDCVPWQDVLCGRYTVENDSVYVGWSLGGMLVLDVAYKAKASILVATTAKITQDIGYPGARPEVLIEMEKGLNEDKKEVLRQFFAAALYPAVNRTQVEELLKDALDIPVEDLQLGLQYLQNKDLRKSLTRIQSPCTIIHSKNDAIVSFSCGQFLSEHISGAKFIACSGPGHAIPVTHPEIISSAIKTMA